MTNRKAIRLHCLDCCCGVRKGSDSPAGCNSAGCALYPYRTAQGRPRLRDIRKRCLDCAGGAKAVRECVMTQCPLWPKRMGRKAA